MHKAQHPSRSEKISVADHIKEFGNDRLTYEQRARCPLCKERMVNRASSAPNSIGHFAHMPGSGYCPTKESSGLPYLNKPPRNPDLAAARRMKATFIENWRKHYSQLNWLVKGLHTKEFIKVIQLANKERIWEYSELEEYQLPYIFATLMDYPSANSFHKRDGSPLRKYWFRCWFDTSVRQYDDLWIHRDKPLMFWRAWYTNPAKGRPKLDDLIEAYDVELSDIFLSQEVDTNAYVVKVITDWLNKNFHIQ